MARTSKAEEAILLASEPRDVRAYLIKRASKPDYFDPISVEAETRLLAMEDRLVDLSLAEYCFYGSTAKVLFEKDPSDWPIRALVLSNQAISKAAFRGFPECLFGSTEKVCEYLETISPDECDALFSNPSLDDGFLESFLSLGEPWNVMPPQQRLRALDSLSTNDKLLRQRTTNDYEEGFAWFMAGKPFEAAWNLIDKLEPSKATAEHLNRFLRNLPADSFKTVGLQEALAKWQPPIGTGTEEEAKENENGRLSDFQGVRQAGARLLAGRHDAVPRTFLNSDDVALRCGAYEGERRLDEETIKAAVERDGDLARVHLIRNPELWRSEKVRDDLLDHVLADAVTTEPQWEFKRRNWFYRKEFPGWFKDEEVTEPDERPISDSSIQDLVAGITGDATVRGIHERLTSLEKRQQTLFLMLAVSLMIIIIKAWQ